MHSLALHLVGICHAEKREIRREAERGCRHAQCNPARAKLAAPPQQVGVCRQLDPCPRLGRQRNPEFSLRRLARQQRQPVLSTFFLLRSVISRAGVASISNPCPGGRGISCIAGPSRTTPRPAPAPPSGCRCGASSNGRISACDWRPPEKRESFAAIRPARHVNTFNM